MPKPLLFAILLSVTIYGCTTVPVTRNDAVTQASVFNGLLAGLYDGDFTQADVKNWGDTGLGTYDKLDGEMIFLEGRAFQANVDGQLLELKDFKTPFAVIKAFKNDLAWEVNGLKTLETFKVFIDERLPDKNHIYAFKVKGQFTTMTVRSVPRQEKPYPKLMEVVKAQSVRERKDVAGTLIGYKFPEITKGINVPGYHFHFISDQKDFGGHVFDFEITNGMIEVDKADQWHVVYPDDEAFRAWEAERPDDSEARAVESKQGK